LSSDEIPQEIQRDIIKLQQMQQQYEIIASQRAQMEIQLKETEYALNEIEKMKQDSILYKSVGALLIKGEKSEVKKELLDSKETIELRVKTLQKQEEQLRKQVQELSTKLQSQLKGQN
jgi:prefoldin beta subunit